MKGGTAGLKETAVPSFSLSLCLSLARFPSSSRLPSFLALALAQLPRFLGHRLSSAGGDDAEGVYSGDALRNGAP